MELRIRNVENWIVETLRSTARTHGRSMEAEIKEVLRKEAMSSKQRLAEELKALTGDILTKYGTLSDSAQLIRVDRDARG